MSSGSLALPKRASAAAAYGSSRFAWAVPSQPRRRIAPPRALPAGTVPLPCRVRVVPPADGSRRRKKDDSRCPEIKRTVEAEALPAEVLRKLVRDELTATRAWRMAPAASPASPMLVLPLRCGSACAQAWTIELGDPRLLAGRSATQARRLSGAGSMRIESNDPPDEF